MYFPTRKLEVSLKTKNINNKRIANEVDEYVMRCLKSTHRNIFNKEDHQHVAELIEDVLADVIESENVISQLNVMCDARNNSKKELADGIVQVTVRYQQKNCLNTTELNYIISVL